MCACVYVTLCTHIHTHLGELGWFWEEGLEYVLRLNAICQLNGIGSHQRGKPPGTSVLDFLRATDLIEAGRSAPKVASTILWTEILD